MPFVHYVVKFAYIHVAKRVIVPPGKWTWDLSVHSLGISTDHGT